MMNLEKLEELASDNSAPSDVRRISLALAAAINDWPAYKLDSVEPFLAELRQDFGELSKANIAEKLKTLSDAWKLESASGLLEAWGDIDERVGLDDLVQRLAPY
jgi:hypothetical protein